MMGSLAGNTSFVGLWAAQAISEVGTQVTVLALPTTAILLLGAEPLQVGLMTAAQFAPFPLLSLLAGVHVDRAMRRRVMVACDLLRGLTLSSIPLAFSLGHLGMSQLYAVAVVVGCATVFFITASQSLLPSVVPREDLLDANGRFEVSRSVAILAGPAIAGSVIQRLGAPIAILIDSVSFIGSASLLGLVTEPRRSLPARRSVLHELRQGLVALFSMPTVWRLSISSALINLGVNIIYAVQLVFVYRVLHFPPGLVGILLGASALGSIAGAVAGPRLTRRIGVRSTLVLSSLACALPFALVPAATRPVGPAVLVAAWALVAAGFPIFNANVVSIRQRVAPPDLIGRVNAGSRTLVFGAIPVGAALGGVLGTWAGLRATIFVGVLVAATAVIPIITSPLHPITATAP